jgi:hypothetical protein
MPASARLVFEYEPDPSLFCPACGQDLDGAAVEIFEDRVSCRKCGQSHRLSSFGVDPPHGVTSEQSRYGFRINAHVRGTHAKVTLVAIALMATWGRYEVYIQNDRGYVFAGVGRFGRRRKFDWMSLQTIALVRRSGRTTRKLVRINADKTIEFGSELDDDQRQYLATMLHHASTF